jgi:voltage-gated potassium channel
VPDSVPRRRTRPVPRTSRWWLPGPGLAVGLLLLVIAGGTAGYELIEGWSAWDALYMTVITVTTVGYREVHPLSRVGEGFTIVLLIGGVGTALYTFTLLATLVVEGGLHLRMEQRRTRRMIDDLEDHFIICGFGRIGSVVADEFRREGTPFVIVERDPERVHEVIAAGMLAVEADASREEVLRRLGIERARGLIAAVGTDAENVYAILTARVLAPNLFIVARAETDDAERKLLRAGASRVLSPYHIGAVQMAQTALRPAVVDFVQLATSSGNLELAMEQIKIAPGSELADRSLVEANLRQRFSVIVVGIQRGGGLMEFNPSADALMRPGDDLVVLGRPASLKELEHTARTARTARHV